MSWINLWHTNWLGFSIWSMSHFKYFKSDSPNLPLFSCSGATRLQWLKFRKTTFDYFSLEVLNRGRRIDLPCSKSLATSSCCSQMTCLLAGHAHSKYRKCPKLIRQVWLVFFSCCGLHVRHSKCYEGDTVWNTKSHQEWQYMMLGAHVI